MPLEAFTGPTMERLLAEARHALGPDAEVVSVRTLRQADGREVYQVLAADPQGAELERSRMAADAGSHPQLRLAPAREDLAHRMERTTGPAVIAFVGPTGVGKTTTIAKLSTSPDVFGGRRVGLLCMDTYRVGAVEQIRTYAEISRLPLEVIYETADLAPAMRRLADVDLILVDTPGRGPRNQQDATMVRQWLKQLAPQETHLVLPAGLQSDLVRRTVPVYRRFGATHLLVTKLDECPEDWTPFDVAAEERLPMRWIADGQEVPRDLRAAAPRLLAAVASLRVRNVASAESFR